MQGIERVRNLLKFHYGCGYKKDRESLKTTQEFLVYCFLVTGQDLLTPIVPPEGTLCKLSPWASAEESQGILTLEISTLLCVLHQIFICTYL